MPGLPPSSTHIMSLLLCWSYNCPADCFTHLQFKDITLGFGRLHRDALAPPQHHRLPLSPLPMCGQSTTPSQESLPSPPLRSLVVTRRQ